MYLGVVTSYSFTEYVNAGLMIEEDTYIVSQNLKIFLVFANVEMNYIKIRGEILLKLNFSL